MAQSSAVKTVKLESYKRIDKPGRDEVSGIIKSRRHKGLYWVHGDSGTEPKIYAVNREGQMFEGEDYKGLRIGNTQNIDWEDIAADTKGNIILADIGNNCTCRQNLSLYIFPEPASSDSATHDWKRIKIKYPGEKRLWGLLDSPSYNAEAVFEWKEGIYIITKVSGWNSSRLFELKEYSENEVNVLKEKAEFQFDDEVTAADIYPEKAILAVLSYSTIWLFSDFEGTDFFSGTVKKLPYKRGGQTEAIAFDDENTLIVTNERGDLFEVALSDFK
ncbi:MAG: hypothetical protein FH748_12065 [Balneolaceae bacterium]|nr:hypothetical protein [Balneolaceae bacterium]